MRVELVELFVRGGNRVVVCVYCLVRVRGISVGVVEVLYEPPKLGGICVESVGFDKLFLFSLLFV